MALADAQRVIAAGSRAVPSELGTRLAETIEGLLAEVEIAKARDVAALRGRRTADLEMQARELPPTG